MKLILLGAPGAGKGTQADILKKKLNVPTISTGNILRAAVKNGTPTGLRAKEYMDAGRLVPDEVEIPDEKIVARMGGRRVCESCGASYHIVNIPPKTEGVCDVCGGKLVQRKDDNPETVRDRLAVYHKETETLKGFYEARGILKTVEDQPTVAGTTQAILRELGVTE